MNNPWIQTFTGKIVYPFSPDYGQINIVDIAHALSMKCRFNGHSQFFYSVAQHCVEVSKISKNPLLGLLHDAAEAYIGDIAAPIKDKIEFWNSDEDYYKPIEMVEDEIFQCIWGKYFGSIYYRESHWKDVIKCDRILLSTEYRDLISNHSKSWGKLPKPLDKKIEPRIQHDAFVLYLIHFDRLTNSKFIDEYKGYL